MSSFTLKLPKLSVGSNKTDTLPAKKDGTEQTTDCFLDPAFFLDGKLRAKRNEIGSGLYSFSPTIFVELLPLYLMNPTPLFTYKLQVILVLEEENPFFLLFSHFY